MVTLLGQATVRRLAAILAADVVGYPRQLTPRSPSPRRHPRMVGIKSGQTLYLKDQFFRNRIPECSARPNKDGSA
jgi:hypothetical protein